MEIVKKKSSVTNLNSVLPSKEKKKNRFMKKFIKGKYLFLLVIPTVICMLLFYYLPMWGILIAFKQYSPFKGLTGSPWVGLKHFRTFFENPFFFRYFRNTILLSFYSLIWGFPAPIIFALILNDVQNIRFKKLVQTVSYMPHFYSTVVVVGLFTMFLSPTSGPVNKLIQAFGHKPISFLADAKYFRTIYVASEIWQNLGWGAIIYLAALSNVDQEMYEAATIDGATRLQKIWYISIPAIQPTIVIMLIMSLGKMMSLSSEKVLLLQMPATYEVSDVIGTYIYRRGLIYAEYSFSAAVGLFNSAVNLVLVLISNFICRKVTETSLW